MKILGIKSGQGNYEVQFFDELSSIVKVIRDMPKAVLVVDCNVGSIYSAQLYSLTKTLPILFIPTTESEKTLQGVTEVLEFLQRNNCVRKTVIVAIGGGIIQDIVTFASHIYYRGLKWMYVPTTLLSMSDSCIGAKCGINFNNFKNQLGVFHAPSKVLVCMKFLDTLTENDIRSGYGEILKLMLIGSVGLSDSLRAVVSKQGFKNTELARFIYGALKVKKGIIEVDEYETDLRRILNYGHTFGHALEAVTQYEVPHGLAVAWGMDVANYVSVSHGLLTDAEFCIIHAFINKYFSCQVSHEISVTELINASRQDKKVTDGKLNMVLLEKAGSLKIMPIDFDESLESILREYMGKYHVIHWD